MALDFPASPLTGDKYPVPAVAGQPQYTYDGLKWTTVGAQITNAKPADAVPLPEALQGAIGVSADYAREDHVHPLNTSLLVKKNYIINGAMMISQEFGAAPLGAIGQHPADMFMYTAVNTSAGVAFGQVQVGTLGGSTHRIRLTVAYAADATQDAGDFAAWQTAVEGYRYADLWAGQGATPKQVTLRFGVKAPAGTYCVAFRNYGAPPTRSYVAEYTIAAGEANTDVVKTVTLPATDGTTFEFGNAAGVFITWAFMCGSTYQTTPNGWRTGNFMGSANQTNFMGTLNNVFELFDVGLYEGTVAPPFVVPDYASELAACMRYWEKGTGFWAGYVASAGVGNLAYRAAWHVRKRAAPTVTGVNNTNSVSFPAAVGTLSADVDAFSEARAPIAVDYGGLFSSTVSGNARL